MIDHRLLKPAGAVVLAGVTAAALTVGQSAFAVGRAAACHPAALFDERQVGEAAQAGHDAVDAERSECAGAQVPDKEPDGEISAQPG